MQTHLPHKLLTFPFPETPITLKPPNSTHVHLMQGGGVRLHSGLRMVAVEALHLRGEMKNLATFSFWVARLPPHPRSTKNPPPPLAPT